MREIHCGTCINNFSGIGCGLSKYDEKNADYCLGEGEPLKIPAGWEIQRYFKKFV